MAGARITIEVEDEGVLATLNELAARAADIRPALQEIGEVVTEQTFKRIDGGGPAPSGSPWAPLSAATIKRKTENEDRILVYHGYLLGSIHYQITGESVEIGTDRKYGAAIQFGMEKGYAGRGHYKTKSGSFPIPWGDIPPRPYLGLSESDEEAVTAIIRRYLTA